MTDIRDIIFSDIGHKKFRAVLTAERSGILSGVEEALSKAAELEIDLELCKKEGDNVGHGERIGNILAYPKQIALAEECLIGTLAKASGIATAARTAVQLADGKIEIVSGSWKKMPPQIKNLVRTAITTGGASFRITTPPMIYMDKNFIRMLGSVKKALDACAAFPDYTKVVQIKGMEETIENETAQAIEGGAGILMVDSGKLEDLDRCLIKVNELGAGKKAKIAFAGNVKLINIPELAQRGADILCIGKEIVDAQLLDLKLDVIAEE